MRGTKTVIERMDEAQRINETNLQLVQLEKALIERDHFKNCTVELGEQLAHIKEVLEWASENVWSVTKDYPTSYYKPPDWRAFSQKHDFTAPTLYEALLCAWKERK